MKKQSKDTIHVRFQRCRHLDFTLQLGSLARYLEYKETLQ